MLCLPIKLRRVIQIYLSNRKLWVNIFGCKCDIALRVDGGPTGKYFRTYTPDFVSDLLQRLITVNCKLTFMQMTLLVISLALFKSFDWCTFLGSLLLTWINMQKLRRTMPLLVHNESRIKIAFNSNTVPSQHHSWGHFQHISWRHSPCHCRYLFYFPLSTGLGAHLWAFPYRFLNSPLPISQCISPCKMYLRKREKQFIESLPKITILYWFSLVRQCAHFARF